MQNKNQAIGYFLWAMAVVGESSAEIARVMRTLEEKLEERTYDNLDNSMMVQFLFEEHEEERVERIKQELSWKYDMKTTEEAGQFYKEWKIFTIRFSF